MIIEVDIKSYDFWYGIAVGVGVGAVIMYFIV